jgi:hypothetical protein
MVVAECMAVVEWGEFGSPVNSLSLSLSGCVGPVFIDYLAPFQGVRPAGNERPGSKHDGRRNVGDAC